MANCEHIHPRPWKLGMVRDYCQGPAGDLEDLWTLAENMGGSWAAYTNEVQDNNGDTVCPQAIMVELNILQEEVERLNYARSSGEGSGGDVY
jgi:hypothetical protein